MLFVIFWFLIFFDLSSSLDSQGFILFFRYSMVLSLVKFSSYTKGRMIPFDILSGSPNDDYHRPGGVFGCPPSWLWWDLCVDVYLRWLLYSSVAGCVDVALEKGTLGFDDVPVRQGGWWSRKTYLFPEVLFAVSLLPIPSSPVTTRRSESRMSVKKVDEVCVSMWRPEESIRTGRVSPVSFSYVLNHPN